MLDGHCWVALLLLCCSPARLSCPLQGQVWWCGQRVRLTLSEVVQVRGCDSAHDIGAMVFFISSDGGFIISVMTGILKSACWRNGSVLA